MRNFKKRQRGRTAFTEDAFTEDTHGVWSGRRTTIRPHPSVGGFFCPSVIYRKKQGTVLTS